MEDEEDVIVFKDDKESEFFHFCKELMTTVVSNDLKIPLEDLHD
jgi:hypothetical protein